MVKKSATKVSSEEADPNGPSATSEASKVLYVGHLPHGFYEQQLRGFFSQFGTVNKVRVSRNKKTGKAKHYAFLEFQSPEVASVAAEAMDGYMMFTQKLDCHVMPATEVHVDLFKGANRKFKSIPWRQMEVQRHNKDRTVEQQAERLARAVSRDAKRRKRIVEAGIDYFYEPLAGNLPKIGKHERFDDN